MTGDYDASEDYDALANVCENITALLEWDCGQFSEETRGFLIKVRQECEDRMADICLEVEE